MGKGSSGTPQSQPTGKGQGGMPQPQGNGMMGGNTMTGGGAPPPANPANTPQTGMTPPGPGQQRLADIFNRMSQQYMGGGGGNFGPPGGGGDFGGWRGPPPGAMPPGTPPAGIAGLSNAMNNYNMPNRNDFMPGGALSAPLDLGGNPNPGGATPSGGGQPQMPQEAMARMQSAAMAGMPQGMQGNGMMGMGGRFGGWGGGMGSRFGMGGMGRFGGGMGRGLMNNGGIVSLADGGLLGAPLSRGGVTYAPAAAAPAPVAPAAPMAPAAPAAPANIAWRPGAAPVGAGGSMFNNISMNPFTQPAAWTPPAQVQPIWQPPAKAVPATVATKMPTQLTYGTYAPNSPGRMGSNR